MADSIYRRNGIVELHSLPSFPYKLWKRQLRKFDASFYCYFDRRNAYLFPSTKKQLALPWTGQGKLPLFLILFLPLAGMALYYFFIGGELTKAFLLPLLTALLVGIAEEMMFRRILYVTLLRSFPEQGSKKPLFISAALFSLLHAVNIFAGSTVPQVLIQLAATFVAGLFFALMYEYTRSIFLMIATHFLWDYILLSGAVHKIPAFAIVMGLLEVMQVLIMLVLLKRKWKQV